STFLQRAYDQIVHDVCLQRLPVVFCLDRAGLVGEDGATHQGAFDLAYLRHIPQLAVFAPRDEAELQRGLITGLSLGSPFALRYPRGEGLGAPLPENLLLAPPLPLGQGEFLLRGDGSLAALAVGSMTAPALEAARELAADGVCRVTVCDARWIKPLPLDNLKKIAATHDKMLILEEGCLAGGFSAAVMEYLTDAGLLGKLRVERLGLPDAFVEHGPARELRARLGLDRAGVAAKMREML
ncbi:MAG: 1-deoxy-D-xylulose-5-phosphate synthase, partial [Deltaproteobacteria bacterium]|nr:1-deoxy-D-xylulose-5-phosphate synthase [Deltaproteobacteria bacterium]